MKNNYTVYIHINKIDGKKYVGITSQDVNRRWRNGNGYYQNPHFYRAILRDGWDNFHHEIIKEGISKEEACKLEKAYISKYKTNCEEFGYNNSTGGENPCEGVKMSDKARKKMSESHKGIIFTEERKKHMSEAAKKRGNGHKGKKGVENGQAGLVRQIDLNSGEVIAEYYGFYEMERVTGFGRVPIIRTTKGKQKQSHGFRWEYIPRRELNVVVG